MPTISRFFGISIKMYYDEHNPPHFHAFYQDFEAMFEIGTGIRIAGKFPPKGEKIIREWAKEYKENLLEVWNLMRTEKPFKKVPGADR